MDDELKTKLARWKAALSDAATGPLVIAREVRQVAEQWSQYKDEVDGMRCTSWLREMLGNGKGLAFFERRARAVDKLGEACRRYMHHELAVWLAEQTLSADQLTRIKRELHAGFKENGDNPLTLSQGSRVVNDILGKQRKPRRDFALEVARLQKRVAELERENGYLKQRLRMKPTTGGGLEVRA